MVILNLIPKKRHPYTINLSGFNTCNCDGTGGDSSSGMTEDERKMLNDVYNEVFKTTFTVRGGGRFERDGTPRTVTITWELSKKGQSITPEQLQIRTNGATETLNKTDKSKTYTGITDNQSWEVIAIYQGQTFKSTVNANFYNTYQIFSGTSVAANVGALTAADITALTSVKRENANTTYSVDLFNTKFILAWPASLGRLYSLQDANHFEYNGSGTVGTVNVPVTEGTDKGKTIPYSVYLMNNPTTGMGFRFTADIH